MSGAWRCESRTLETSLDDSSESGAESTGAHPEPMAEPTALAWSCVLRRGSRLQDDAHNPVQTPGVSGDGSPLIGHRVSHQPHRRHELGSATSHHPPQQAPHHPPPITSAPSDRGTTPPRPVPIMSRQTLESTGPRREHTIPHRHGAGMARFGDHRDGPPAD